MRTSRLPVRREEPDGYGQSPSPSWRDTDWSSIVKSVVVDGLRVNYVDVGDRTSPTVCLLLHGIGNSWHFWLETLGPLSRSARAIALDLPGFGDSESARGRLTAVAAGRHVERFCQTLELGPVAVCGHSMGALVAVSMATEHPHRVERLLLVAGSLLSIINVYEHPLRSLPRSASPLFTLAVGAATAVLPSPAAVRRLVLGNRILRALFLWRFVQFPGRLDAALLVGALSGLGRIAVARAIKSGLGYDYRAAIARLESVHVLNGDRDRQVPIRDVEEFASLCPLAEVVVLAETGHWPMLERPRFFNRWILQSLGVDGGDGV